MGQRYDVLAIPVVAGSPSDLEWLNRELERSTRV
jgi:hypothetical protein